MESMGVFDVLFPNSWTEEANTWNRARGKKSCDSGREYRCTLFESWRRAVETFHSKRKGREGRGVVVCLEAEGTGLFGVGF